ncbi:MAG: hypothetical protein J5922_02155, partial [Clostridia bacterium]|nr:hypothetical protein [Clostridia bacterium]
MSAFEKYQSRIETFASQNLAVRKELLKSLCLIPSPSGKERARAEFCLEYLHSIGAKDAFIDEDGNVIFEYNCK